MISTGEKADFETILNRETGLTLEELEELRHITKGFKEALHWDSAEMFVCQCGERWLCGMNSPDFEGIRTVNSNFDEANKYYVEGKDGSLEAMIHLCNKCGKPLTIAVNHQNDWIMYDTYDIQPYGRWEKKQKERHNNLIIK